MTIPAAPLGEENPLPALRPLDEVHGIDVGDRSRLPADMARQIGYAPLRTVLPVRLRDGYGRDRAPAALDAIVVENDRLRATVLPGLGGRLYSLLHKPTGRELLYRNPVFQPANLGLAGAWFAGGVEWNLGATGHCAYTCAPLHAARLAAPDGGEMLRLWGWERLRDLPFQIDLWLPDGSDFLYVGVRVRNPHDRTVPVYWWSNAAVPETPGTRVLAPADAAYRLDSTRVLERVPLPRPYGDADGGVDGGVDATYTTRCELAVDYFFDIDGDGGVHDGERRWIAALDADGRGLVQTSTDELRGRKLFLWGAGPGGRRWQEWLGAPGAGGYLEIQAGLARTQLEHLPMPADSQFAWLEAYGPLSADPAAVHGDDWAAARAETARRLQAALPRERLDAARAMWLAHADDKPADRLARGCGWGALEIERGGFDLPGTPFDRDDLGAAQQPWLELLATGVFPRPAGDEAPGPALVSPQWRDLLEAADTPPGSRWFLDYYLGLAQWAAGDRAQAVRSWERSTAAHPSFWALRALAAAEAESGESARAADRYLAAYACLRDHGESDAVREPEPGSDDSRPAGEPARGVLRALLHEAVPVLLAAGRAADAARLLDEPAAGAGRPQDDGRTRLLRVRTRLALGDAAGARALLDAGFTVADLREGDEALSEAWYEVAAALSVAGGLVTPEERERAAAADPLPARYDFRLRPPSR